MLRTLGDLESVSTTMGSPLDVPTWRTSTRWPTSKVGQMNWRSGFTSHSLSFSCSSSQLDTSLHDTYQGEIRMVC